MDKYLAQQLKHLSIGRLNKTQFDQFVKDYFYSPKTYDIDVKSPFYQAVEHAYYDLDEAYKVYLNLF